MQEICLVVPIQAGMTDDARAFMRELESSRKESYEASERRLGITREVWHLASPGDADVLIAHIETDDFAAALRAFSGSRDAFDLWFKRRLAESTGLDLNAPPAITLPELLSSYTAA
jgi:hypothetical protein